MVCFALNIKNHIISFFASYRALHPVTLCFIRMVSDTGIGFEASIADEGASIDRHYINRVCRLSIGTSLQISNPESSNKINVIAHGLNVFVNTGLDK